MCGSLDEGALGHGNALQGQCGYVLFTRHRLRVYCSTDMGALGHGRHVRGSAAMRCSFERCSADAGALGHGWHFGGSAAPQGAGDAGGDGCRLGGHHRGGHRGAGSGDGRAAAWLGLLLLLRGRLGGQGDVPGGGHAAGHEARVVHRHHGVVKRPGHIGPAEGGGGEAAREQPVGAIIVGSRVQEAQIRDLQEVTPIVHIPQSRVSPCCIHILGTVVAGQLRHAQQVRGQGDAAQAVR
mmetsp:Transcript_15843/g.47687  ORF Transcript_15843/g.47687 Transcript_15843/m.47687 type:complete len:238 (-) Transcript_15843:12-725(-)